MERYGIELNRIQRKELVKAIQRGDSTIIERQSHRVTVREVQGMRVVYDQLRKEIVTFLPKEEDDCSEPLARVLSHSERVI
jgi:hypothetical protein